MFADCFHFKEIAVTWKGCPASTTGCSDSCCGADLLVVLSEQDVDFMAECRIHLHYSSPITVESPNPTAALPCMCALTSTTQLDSATQNPHLYYNCIFLLDIFINKVVAVTRRLHQNVGFTLITSPTTYKAQCMR